MAWLTRVRRSTAASHRVKKEKPMKRPREPPKSDTRERKGYRWNSLVRREGWEKEERRGRSGEEKERRWRGAEEE